MLVAEARPRPYASGVVAHGWNIDEEPLRAVLEASTPVSSFRGCGLERWGCRGGGSLSTLLGPEATGHRIRVIVSDCVWCLLGAGVVGQGGPGPGGLGVSGLRYGSLVLGHTCLRGSFGECVGCGVQGWLVGSSVA